MPEYFPDLNSVKVLAEAMRNHKDDKAYKGLVPRVENELPAARVQLAGYMRDVWNDEVAALEIELAVTQETYHDKISQAIKKRMFTL